MRTTFTLGLALGVMTQKETQIVLALLVLTVVLLVIGMVKTWNRVSELEDVVYEGDKATNKAKQLVDEFRDSSNSETM